MGSKDLLLLFSIILIAVTVGCNGSSAPVSKIPSPAIAKGKLIFPINITTTTVESTNASLEPIIKSSYPWVYDKEAAAERIPENYSFIMRFGLQYPLGSNKTYPSDVKFLIKYYPGAIRILKPVNSYEYPFIEKNEETGPQGGKLSIDSYWLGRYGELRKGESQDMLLIGTTNKLETFVNATTPVYIQFIDEKNETILSDYAFISITGR